MTNDKERKLYRGSELNKYACNDYCSSPTIVVIGYKLEMVAIFWKI